MELSTLKRLIAQGSFNYYSKHIDVICQMEMNGAKDIIINIDLFINRILIKVVKVDTSEHRPGDFKLGIQDWINKQTSLEVERLKERAYLSLTV